MKKTKTDPLGGLSVCNFSLVAVPGYGLFSFGEDEGKEFRAFMRAVNKGYIPPGLPKLRKGQTMPIYRLGPPSPEKPPKKTRRNSG